MEPNSIPGKQKCETLRTIRRKIAGANDIPFETEDCTYGGPCRGTCPKCDEEIRFLDRALKEKQVRGETVVLEGLGEEALAPYGTEAPEIGQPFGFHEGAELDPAEGPLLIRPGRRIPGRSRIFWGWSPRRLTVRCRKSRSPCLRACRPIPAGCSGAKKKNRRSAG